MPPPSSFSMKFLTKEFEDSSLDEDPMLQKESKSFMPKPKINNLFEPMSILD